MTPFNLTLGLFSFASDFALASMDLEKRPFRTWIIILDAFRRVLAKRVVGRVLEEIATNRADKEEKEIEGGQEDQNI